jgi:hypothetical protein
LLVSTHVVPHIVWGAKHMHDPALQYEPSWQPFPQLPQLVGLVCVLMHTPPQLVVGALHIVMHVPALQTCPVAHACPHDPQFAGSVMSDRHALPHIESGGTVGEQAHAPVMQVSPAPHA